MTLKTQSKKALLMTLGTIIIYGTLSITPIHAEENSGFMHNFMNSFQHKEQEAQNQSEKNQQNAKKQKQFQEQQSEQYKNQMQNTIQEQKQNTMQHFMQYSNPEQVKQMREQMLKEKQEQQLQLKTRISSEFRQEINEKCGNIADPVQRKECVSNVVSNHIEVVADKVDAKFDRLIQLLQASKTLSQEQKNNAIAEIKQLKQEIQTIKQKLQNKEITAQQASEQLKQLSQKARSIVNELKNQFASRIYTRLQRVVSITENVYNKVKNSVDAETSAQLELIIDQLKALVEAGEPQDITVAKQELSQMRDLVQQFVQLLKQSQEQN